MLDKMNLHYAFTNPATVHDEEALTSLELAGRQGAKINELVTAYNELEADTNDHLEAQDKEISQRLEAQDNKITTIQTKTVPEVVENEMDERIEDGTFNDKINEYAGNLEARLNNLIGSVTTGSTTMDAEVIDGRTDWKNRTWSSVGEAVRTVTEELFDVGITKALIPSHYIGIFSTASSFVKARTSSVTLVPDSSQNISMGVYASYPSGKGGVNYTLIIDSDLDYRVYVRKTDTPVYQHDVTYTYYEQTGNTVRFKTEEDFLCIVIQLTTREETELKFSLIENTSQPQIYPVHLSDNVKGFNSYINTANWGLLLGTTTDKNYTSNGKFVREFTVNPNTAYGVDALTVLHTFEENIPYRVIIRGLGTRFLNLLYGTVGSWGTGSFATLSYLSKYDKDTNTTIIDFIVKDNSMAAKYFMILFTNPTEAFDVKVGVTTNYDNRLSAEDTKYIAFCGDSLTAQQYFSYINTDKAKIGFAVGGEGIAHIFARTGVEPLYLTNDKLVSGKQAVELSLSGLFQQGMGNINPVTIAGIEGTLSLENSIYYFTPTEDIENTPVYNPEVIPYQSSLNIDTYVFWLGTNNGTWTSEQIFEAWEKVLAVYPNSLILGLTNDSTDDKLAKVSELDSLGAKLGTRFVPLHEWIVEHGLDYVGLTPTSADTIAINNGKIPPSLLSDTVHFNENGKKCVSYLVSERLKLFKAL